MPPDLGVDTLPTVLPRPVILKSGVYLDGVPPSDFRCTSTPFHGEWNEVPKCNGMQVCQLIQGVLDGVPPSVFRCTSTPMETGPIDTCVET